MRCWRRRASEDPLYGLSLIHICQAYNMMQQGGQAYRPAGYGMGMDSCDCCTTMLCMNCLCGGCGH